MRTSVLLFLRMTFTAILVVISFVACSDDNDPTEGETPTIVISQDILTNGVVLAAGGSEKNISFSTNTYWALNIASTTGGSTWCTVSLTSGSRGETSVKFTVTDNADYDDRSVAVTIEAGTASKTFMITQKCKEAILVTANRLEVAQEGGVVNVEVKSNVDYQMAISEKTKSWITQTTTRSLSTRNHTFNIAANEEYEKRDGEIYFKKGELVDTVRIYQAGGAVIMLTKDKYAVSDKGETITVEIKSNVKYGIKMPQVDWIYDQASSRGVSSHTLKYRINPNETYDSRSAQIIYFDKDNTAKADTLTITQVQKDAIVLANSEYTMDAKRQTIEVELSSNIDYSISIADDGKDWISSAENTRALTTRIIRFNIAENTSDDSRISLIAFASSNGVSQNIKIIQQGALPVFHVATAGTLSDLIDDSVKGEITKLKITGKLNFADMGFLHEMSQIQVLDLSEVNLKRIRSMDFSYFRSLVSITLPDVITSIDNYSFMDCSSLTSITIPDKVTSLGADAFAFCEKLTSINVSNSNNSYSSIDGVLYDKDASTLIKCPEGKESFTIPSSVINIGDVAFHLCSKLASINVSNNSAKYSSIEGVVYDKNASTLIKFPENKMFITFPQSVINIGDGAFSNSCLTSITIPNSVISIGNRAFASSSLTSITIPNSVTNIGIEAFSSSSLTSILLPNSLTSIGDKTFEGCQHLTSIAIPNSVTSIGVEAFSVCRRLASVTIPGSVESIKYAAFSWCSGLRSVTISDGVKRIGDHAFWGCSNVSAISIPNSVTIIEAGAFSSCTLLSSITIPSSVTFTGDYVFWGCSNINEIHLRYKSVAGMNPYLFENVNTGVCTLYVPRGCKSAYSSADGWKYFKNIIEE